MRLMKDYILLLLLYLECTSTLIAQQSALVFLENDQLTYVHFPVEGQTDSLHVIPNFSHAGYLGGGIAIPEDIPVKVTIDPAPGDDTQRIQAAIDQVSAMSPDHNGFRGIVLLTKGYYSISRTLNMNTSGVILRGEGQHKKGTVIHTNLRTKHTAIQIAGHDGMVVDVNTTQKITSSYVSIGAYRFLVKDASEFVIGDTIAVTRTPNQTWIEELGMDEETMCANDPGGCDGWTPSSYTINHQRIITNIVNDTITINIPIVDVMEEHYGGGQVAKASAPGRISYLGVENLRVESLYTTNNDEAHGWTAVDISNAQNCWVKKVTAEYFGFSTVCISNAHFNTIEDCAFINPKSEVSGGRRYSFVVQGGTGNLFQRCYAREGRHDFATGSRVNGPNVFLDGLGEEGLNDIGPHHRWSTGLLFDNIVGNQIRVQNRGSSGSGHGWAGAQTMFWNVETTEKDIKVESPKGSINWGIGCIGPVQEGAGYWDSWGTHVLPRSLYLQQLKDRLGEEAVNEIAISQQLNGEITDMLKNWQGIGSIYNGGTIGQSPAVAFVNPNGAINVDYWEGTDIEINASDEDGSISEVTLLINGEPIQTLTDSPYLFENVKPKFENLPEGANNCYAFVTDNDGNTEVARLIVYGKKKESIELSQYEELALCGAYASNHQEGREAYFAIDNLENHESRWSSEENGAVLVVEACDARYVDAIGIMWYEGDSRQAIFDLEVSLDSVNWRNIYSGNSSGNNAYQEPYIVEDSIKYMRYTGFGNTVNRWNSIIEARFYKAVPAGIDTTSNILHIEEMNNELLIYPNPAHGEISISNPFDKIAGLKVMDLSGKTHLLQSSASKEFILESSQFSPGIYLIQVQSNGKLAQGKLVITK